MHLPYQTIAGDIGAKQNRLRDSPCKVSSNCAEGNLDAQYLTGIASSVPTFNLYYEENDFVSMLENVTSSASPPSVITISYASFGVDADYASRFNSYAQMAGSMGITIVSSEVELMVCMIHVHDIFLCFVIIHLFPLLIHLMR